MMSDWRHNVGSETSGHLIRGTIRVAREDFDTQPTNEYRKETFDEIVSKLNSDFKEQVCAALGEHADTEDARIIEAILWLRKQAREPEPLAGTVITEAQPLSEKAIEPEEDWKAAIGYPDDWDTAVYPTAMSALVAVYTAAYRPAVPRDSVGG